MLLSNQFNKEHIMLTILADSAAGEANISQTFILVGLSALFFYFILWRPDKKRRMKMKYLRDHLKKGILLLLWEFEQLSMS